MKLYVRNMVCIRCKMAVKEELRNLGINWTYIELGHIDILEPVTELQLTIFRLRLLKLGLELIDDKRSILIQKIKDVVEIVHDKEEESTVNFSDYLSEKLNQNYTYLANLFSLATGTTIEHFMIVHKIERVKALLIYNELTLTEIAYKMHYSSVAHLSNQFKKVTGFTTSQFRIQEQESVLLLEYV